MLRDPEIFDGLTWDIPLTEEIITYIENNFGKLAKNLIELADFVRKSRTEYMKTGPVNRADTRWIEVDDNIRLMVPVDKWGTLIRTFASAKLLRPKIELTAGSEQQAREFYGKIVTAISGQDSRFSKIKCNAILSSISRGENQVKEVTNLLTDFYREELRFSSIECNVETITKTLENWHNLLIYTDEQKKGPEANTNLASTKQNDLTDTESNILEALGDNTMHGPDLLKKAGYDNSSHYRAILSGLVKRNILDRNARGYHRKSAHRQ
jgi:hypothetical protein